MHAFAVAAASAWLQDGRVLCPPRRRAAICHSVWCCPSPWGPTGSATSAVQTAGAANHQEVTCERLCLSFAEDLWHVCRNGAPLLGEAKLYLRRDGDVIVRDECVKEMRDACREIALVHVPDRPHQLLKRYGRKPAAP